MVAAILTFRQGVTAAVPGRALRGVLGSVVTLSNADDAGVVEHRWSVLEVPPGSTLPTGTLGGDTATVTFTPDVAGRCFRFQLITVDALGNEARDIRNFGVPDENGILLPSFQPKAGVDYTKDEFNFLGQLRSWSQLIDDAFAATLGAAQAYTDAALAGAGVPQSYVDSADLSLTTRVSAEESARDSADTSVLTLAADADSSIANSLTTRVSTEESARASADTVVASLAASADSSIANALTSLINVEGTTRASADTSLTSRLSTEEVARASADAAAISIAADSLTAADTSTTARVSTEESTRSSADTSLTTRVSAEESARASAVASLLSLTGSADTSLTTTVSVEVSTRASADTSLTTRVSNEESARASADTSITSTAASLTTRVSTEESTRSSGAASFTTRVSTEESTRDSAVTSALTLAASADSSISNSLTTRVCTEESTRTSTVTLVSAAAARGQGLVVERSIFDGEASTGQASGNPLVLGAVYWDPAVAYGQNATGSVFLHVVIETTSAGNGAYVDLYQFTGAGAPAVIGTVAVSTSTTREHKTLDLTTVFKTGGTAVAAVYLARLYLATNDGTNFATCSAAWLEITP